MMECPAGKIAGSDCLDSDEHDYQSSLSFLCDHVKGERVSEKNASGWCAIDCTHICIQSPGRVNSELFRNRNKSG